MEVTNKAVFNIYLRQNDKNTIFYNDSYFDLNYEIYWLEDDFAKRVIKEIENGEVIGGKVIDTVDYGIIPPEYLSTGVKTLLLFKYDTEGYIFNGSKMGDNCVKFLEEIAREKPVNMMLFHILGLYGLKNVEYNFIESGISIIDSDQYPEMALKLIMEVLREGEIKHERNL